MTTVQKIQDELNFLKFMLEHLGFSIVVDEKKSTEDAINDATRYVLSTVFTISIEDDLVGECIVIVSSSKKVEVDVSLNSFTIPGEMINKLLLLGFRVEGSHWLEYEVVVDEGINR